MNKVRPMGKKDSGSGRRGGCPARVAGALLLVFLLPLAAGDANDVRLVVRVFRIPREQSFDAVALDGHGRPAAVQACGDVTSAFPRATVFFPTELAADASDSAVTAAILDRVAFSMGGMAVKSFRLEELKSLELALGREGGRAEVRFEESPGQGRTSRYWVLAELLPAGNGKLLVRLRFDAGWSAQAGSLGVGISEDVVSAPFELSRSKLLLIGARAAGERGSQAGTVYWLAVAIVSKG